MFILIVVLLVIFLAALFSLPVYLLWNWLMPTLFNLPEITWFQAWGLMFLISLLFRSAKFSFKD